MDNPPPTRDTNIHTIVKAQIVFLLSTLTEENFERNQAEIRSLSEQHGVDTYLHFIRRLIVHSQARLSSSAASSAFDPSTALTFRLLIQETQRLARDPFLADRFRDGIDKGEGDVFRHFDLARFVDRVGLRPLERLVLAASIVAAPTRKDLATQAQNIIRLEWENAVLSLCQHPSFDHADLNPSQLAKLLTNLLSDPPADAPVLDALQRQELLRAARTKYGDEIIEPILQRILPNLSLAPGTDLVDTFIDLGPENTGDVQSMRALLFRFGITDANPPTDSQLLEVVQALARFAVEGVGVGDVSALVAAFGSFHTKLDWPAVIRSFDWPDRHSVDTATLKLLIAILLNSPEDAEPHAVTGFWDIWDNALAQLRLLDALLSLPGDTFNFVTLPGRRIVTVDDVSVASPTIKSLAANVQGHTWNSLDLFEVLVRFSEIGTPEIVSCVHEMLDKAVKISAELVHMGLLQVERPDWSGIRREYGDKLLHMFLNGHPNHQLVFMRIWQIRPTYLTDAFRDFYNESEVNITRILDVAQDLKILDSLLDVQPFTFALDVAALASRREYLNLDKWLQDNINTHGKEFLMAILDFLQAKMESEKAARTSEVAVDSQRTMPLNPQTITIFLRTLRNSSSMMEKKDVDYCLEVRNSCLQVHPRLMNLTPGSEVEPGFTVVSYSPEIEAEVDSIYKQMYDESITIDEVIVMLQRFKNSTNPRENEIFSCMLHFLFDEYKFFQAYYPARELAMTGYLFGSLIQYELVDYIPLGIAIRCVMDALKCPPQTNLFKFGLEALARFEGRLAEWRPLCELLLEIPNLLQQRPELGPIIHRALANSSDKSSNPAALTVVNGHAPDIQPPFTAIQPDSIPGDIEPPSEESSDKMLFIVNNLAPSNFESKIDEMREQFKDDYSRWFANYLVDQRVSTEPNNHQLYLRFLDAIGSKTLFRFILHETFVKSAALLNSDKTMQSSSERAILKNVGSWLGTITLARDQPIKHKNLAYKELLLEAFDNTRLIVAIPFVCKSLEPCASSKVFRPPNPWLMAVIGLLAELYHFAELKLNLKFEIEVLCKALNINLDTVEATSLIRNRPLLSEPALDYVPDIDSLPMGGYDPSNQLHADPHVLGLGPPAASDSGRAVGSHIEGILSSLLSLVTISPQLAPLHTNIAFKRAIQLGVDRAVREIILPVVERSVTIAGISTRELVVKDFATDTNVDRLQKSAHMMAQKLAGSLALVTCKEPLRSNLATHMRQSLAEHGFGEIISEQIIMLLVQDNLEFACQAIEQAAKDRAVDEIDDALMPSYEGRRRHNQQRPNQPYWDVQAPPQNIYPVPLPDPLRIKASGVQPVQLRVYEDFGNDPKRLMTSRPGSTVSYTRNEPPTYSATPPPDQPVANSNAFSHAEAMQRFLIIVKELDAILEQLPVDSLTALPANHEVRQLVRQVLFLTTESAEPSHTALALSQKIVQCLYRTQSQLGREIYVALLQQLCDMFRDVRQEALPWLAEAEDDRKFNVPVTVLLFKSGLLKVSQQDVHLAKLLANPRPILQTYVAGLIRECVTANPPVASHHQFVTCVPRLIEIYREGTANEDVISLVDDLRGVRRPASRMAQDPVTRIPSAKLETDELRSQMQAHFQRWVGIYQRSPKLDVHFEYFVRELEKTRVLSTDDVSLLFFRVCGEASISHYVRSVATGQFDYAFQAVDAFARLVTMLVRFQGDKTGMGFDQAKVYYLKKILSTVTLILAHLHEEQGMAFQQKPFFRFFSSLVNDFHAIKSSLGSVYFRFLTTISETFSSLQPRYFPGFAFSWTCLVSHRHFMPNLLMSEHREGWSSFHELLLSLFKFLAPFLKNADLQPAMKDLYRGTLRLLLVLLHDFPEFLSEYYFTLCDAIPPRCVQMRNIILSAYPAGLILPDPNLRDLKLDAIPEMGPIPAVLSDFAAGLRDPELRSQLDQYLVNRGTPLFLPSLKSRLHVADGTEGSPEGYDLSFINSLVMYIGMSSVAQAKVRSGATLFVPTDPGVVALQYLATNLDMEGQYHLLSSMVLHLRYPNAHTQWFSSLVLHLFLEIQEGRFGEVVTRVLLERFVVHRPHPWGAMVTFIELMRNPKYEFASKEFVRIASEVTLLLESVARTVFQA
ncbi:CCR4-Not complex component [Punctularia strigosozonata HHB-11173 SS5]|uniref:CCR4-Not complex component n=1 Tax=Punctularia strigosozonata (strain HHB-11173) TaxID=741275 RepID=UPI0004417A99|nr:CCR4-Not complex component [Punctularia strigosozonata HHB-11173 SS5]EIN07655.1 CCR4-Not complex component [Punctularia strigosozonata HHB-11173 SS5]